jgi:hypothetical protein
MRIAAARHQNVWREVISMRPMAPSKQPQIRHLEGMGWRRNSEDYGATYRKSLI